MTDVQGRCPACRAASLFLGAGGHVTCARIDCPNPTAADDLLHRAEDFAAPWEQQDDGTWTLTIHDGGGILSVPRQTTMGERARFAAAWKAMSAKPGPTPAETAAGPCESFPDHCPNPVDVPAQSPFHGGGIRCGCATPKESRPMAHTTTLRLKTDVDNTTAAELTPRLKTAIQEALNAARARGVEDEAGAAAYAVMVEILRVRQATPAETAIDRVRALHRNEYESCAECTHEFGVPYPCPTIRALDGEEQPRV